MYIYLYIHFLNTFKSNASYFLFKDPLWNALMVAGLKDGKPFLGTVDLIGTQYEGNGDCDEGMIAMMTLSHLSLSHM